MRQLALALLATAGLAAAVSVPPVEEAALARPAGTTACGARVSFGVLPVWARAGFSDPGPRLPHVLGRRGRIAALVFGYPLLSPPSTVRSNKILWVARTPPRSASDLRIHAQRMVGLRNVGPPVRRLVPTGPGPSIVDLPRAGCWRLTLRFAGTSDSLDLVYRSSR